MREENCKSLWASVLEQAVKDARNDAEGAWAWLHSEDQGIGSFLWICDIFEISPDLIRSNIGNKRKIPAEDGKMGIFKKPARRKNRSYLLG
jgi:hypothetical protein